MGIYLVREADAGGRFSWPGPDRLRPLTGVGWQQAQELAERLDGARITRIVSSPWLRCQQTVLPLAEARQLPIDVVEPEDVSAAVAWLASDAARFVTGVVLPVDAGVQLR